MPTTWRVEPGVKVPTPVSPTGPKIPRMLAVPAFIETDAKTFGAERAFDAKTLPTTCKVDPGVKVPTPVSPTGPKIPRMLEVEALSDVEANTTGDTSAFDAKTLPWTWRFEVGVAFPIPTKNAGP